MAAATKSFRSSRRWLRRRRGGVLPGPAAIDRHRHQQMRARPHRLRRAQRRVRRESPTTQTSPTLLRSPLRLGFGPSMFGVKSPVTGSSEPTNARSSSPKVAVYSSSFHATSTMPSDRSSFVFGLPSAPFWNAIASNCCSCFGNDRAADARHAGAREDLDPVDLVEHGHRRGLHRAGDADVARPRTCVGRDIHGDRRGVRRDTSDLRHLDALAETDVRRGRGRSADSRRGW